MLFYWHLHSFCWCCSVKVMQPRVCRLFTVQLSSLKTETERIQAQKDQLQGELLARRTELDGLRVAISHVQSTNKSLSSDKVNPFIKLCFTVKCYLYILYFACQASTSVSRMISIWSGVSFSSKRIQSPKVRNVFLSGVSTAAVFGDA